MSEEEQQTEDSLAGPTSESTEFKDPTVSEAVQEQKEWFWTENMKGDGQKPDFLLDKYQSVADQAKGYRDLEKKLGAFKGAPEDYNLEHLGIDEDQYMAKAIKDIGKELNMSQEGMDKFVSKLMTAQEIEQTTTLEDEVAKLGDEGIQVMNQYKYFKDNHLKPEEAEVVQNWIRTADDLKIFAAMTKGIYSKRMPTENDQHLHSHQDSLEAIDKEMSKNLQRYNTDETYRKELRARRKWIIDRQNR